MSRGTRASLPPFGSKRPDRTGPSDALTQILTLEDDGAFVFDLSAMAGPCQLRVQLGLAVAMWASSATGGRRTTTVKNTKTALSAFLKWVDLWNGENSSSADTMLYRLEDINPFHVLRYRLHLETKHGYHTARGYYSDLCVLLRLAPGVSNVSRREASKRIGQSIIPVRPIRRYSHSEHSAILHAARRVVVEARARVTRSYSLTQQVDALSGDERTRATALRDVLLHGSPQSKDGISLMAAEAAPGQGGLQVARRLLFLSPDEAFAAAVLIACHRGLNLSPIVTAKPPMEHEPGVLQLDLDKPRRGQHLRFWPELFIEGCATSNRGIRDSGAEALKLVAEATEPARRYLAAVKKESNRLLIYWPPSAAAPCMGIPASKTGSRASWVPEGTTISFRRLRRSVPEEGVSKEPTNHNPDTHLYYIRTDPDALAAAQEEASRGVQDLVENARQSLAIRAAADDETDKSTDALLVNCSDPRCSPATGLPCTSGFYSFLDCLECPNAATVPRLIPRQLAAQTVLEQLRDGMGETWESRFAQRYYRLIAVLHRYTPAELEHAAQHSAAYIPLIVAALRHEVPS